MYEKFKEDIAVYEKYPNKEKVTFPIQIVINKIKQSYLNAIDVMIERKKETQTYIIKTAVELQEGMSESEEAEVFMCKNDILYLQEQRKLIENYETR